MNIKTLLLGSAAGLVAVAGAQAADAVYMPEPEAVEYVRVCDVYGAGFFYIPGTETCLRISGFVRYKMGAATDSFNNPDATPNYEGYVEDGWNKNTRARVNFDARSDTEWGLLQGYVRMQADWGRGATAFQDGPVSVDQAWLALGGLRAGYTQSAWAETVQGVTYRGSFSDGGLYFGDQQNHLVQYNFGGKTGLFGTISLEDDALEGDGYVPDVVAVLGYQDSWGAVWARFGYDNSYNNPNKLDSIDDESGYGVQLAAQINLPNNATSFRVMGWYADSDNRFSATRRYANQNSNLMGRDGNGAAEWSALVAVNHKFTDKISASAGFQYFSDFYQPLTDLSSGKDGYAADLSVVYEPVQNFEIRAEGNYAKIDDLDGSVSGFLWFLRRF